MPASEDVINAISELIEKGKGIIDLKVNEDGEVNLTALNMRYERWYTKALSVIQQIIPGRVKDFRDSYKLEKRKEINFETYTISDYLGGLQLTRQEKILSENKSIFQSKLLNQISILTSAKDIAPSILRDIKTELQAEILDSDIATAKELLKARHLRSAGVVCGVALEAHLKSVATRHSVMIAKKKPVLSDLNDALKNANVYDVATWRLLQRDADIRNICAHAGPEPTQSQVEDLIRDTEKIVKEVI